MALTAKQAAFVAEYLIDLNATQAAIRAGYSEKTADVIGYENLNKPQIKEAIEKGKAERSEKTGIDAAWVLTEAVACYKLCKNDDDLKTAKGFLELAGKHTTVQAFNDKIDLNIGGEVTQVTRIELVALKK